MIKIAHAAQQVLKRPADLLARYGGEEFAVILPNTDETGACNVATQIQLAIQALGIPHVKSKEQIVTLSLGIATQIPSIDKTSEAFISEADKALYQAKQEGRNCWIHYHVISQNIKNSLNITENS